jgi:hypothetical protein
MPVAQGYRRCRREASPEWITDSHPSGFARLIRIMLERGILASPVQKRYRHRISTDGKPLDYIGLIGRKTVDVPAVFLV